MTAAPRATGRWMLQHARVMRSDPLGFLLDCAAEFGDIVEFPIPRQPVFFVNDPDAVARVLQGNHPAYGKNTVQYRSLALVTGEGLLVSDGEGWRHARRLVQPAFHASTMVALGGHVADALGRLNGRWDAETGGAVVDVDEAMMRVTLEIVGQALFSTDLAPDAANLVEAVSRALDVVIARARTPVPLPGWLPTRSNRRLAGSLRTLDRAVAAMIADHRAPGRARADLLSLLLAASDGTNGTGLSDRQVRDEVITLVVAGHETVASALTWALWLVAGDPQVGTRLAAEADHVLGDRPPGAEDFAALPYARQVMDEALRLYPPAWVVTRRVLADDVLAGSPVPAGALIIVSPYTLHRHPDVWEEPEVFDPDRFAPDRRADAVRRGYLPFGAGPRLCVGRDFALLESTLVLAATAGRYALKRVPGSVQLDPSVTLRPKSGLPMRLRRR